jgi:hypothetical protein
MRATGKPLQPAAQAPHVGFAAAMPDPGDFDPYVPAGLASLGIEVDEVDLAVMRATHELYWPAIAAFMEVDLSGVQPELQPDLSRAPQEPSG